MRRIATDFSAVESIVGKNIEFNPNPENSAVYDRLFLDYKNIYKSLKKAYKQSNEVRFANQR
jgi:xylulokinase